MKKFLISHLLSLVAALGAATQALGSLRSTMKVNAFAIPACLVMFFAFQVVAQASLQVASVTDMQDPNGFDANMAAGAFAGNDAQGGGAVGVAQLTASFGDLDWTFVTDNLSNTGGIAGTLELSQNVSGTFAIALKSAGGYSLYKFVGTFSAGDDFSFKMDGVSTNQNGNVQDISHGSLYTSSSGPVVPEPAMFIIWSGIACCCGLAAKLRRSAD